MPPPVAGDLDAPHSTSEPFQPWQLFTLAGLVAATVVVLVSRGESPAGIVLLSLIVFAAAGVGLAALRTFLPLTGSARLDLPQVLGGRTRAALEREKTLVLRAIKELEFDRAMGKVSETDFSEMTARLRGRAARLIRQLDAGAGYRQEIEREIERRVGRRADAGLPAPAPAGGTVAGVEAPREPEPQPLPRQPDSPIREGESRETAQPEDDRPPAAPPAAHPAAAPCPSCSTMNDADARFCKMCGARLGGLQ